MTKPKLKHIFCTFMLYCTLSFMGSVAFICNAGAVSTQIEDLMQKAEQGDAEAQLKLGTIYEKGQALPKDYKKAAQWYHKAAVQGNKVAAVRLGLAFRAGKGVPQSHEEAVKWYRKAAEDGLKEAQYNLGLAYENGRGVLKDNAQAVLWYRKAAEQYMDMAQYSLGLAYYHGRGVARDYVLAAEWFRKSAAQGNDLAQYYLGSMYLTGEGVPQDYKQAAELFHTAAAQGNVKAQDNIGVLYTTGQGVPQDYEKAFKWLSKAADKKSPMALYNLGMLYDLGLISNLQGEAKNNGKAMRLFREAAELGFVEAQYKLGSNHYLGKFGISQDNKRAYAWFFVATANGHEDGEKMRDKVAAKLSAAQMQEANALAQQYLAKCLPAKGLSKTLETLQQKPSEIENPASQNPISLDTPMPIKADSKAKINQDSLWNVAIYRGLIIGGFMGFVCLYVIVKRKL